MTVWNPNAIAGFAKTAGFRGDDLATAVAVAIVASNGADHLLTRWSTNENMTYCGLWQIPAHAPTAEQVGDLLNPEHNASYAYGLVQAMGWDGGWSHAHETGAWQYVLPAATEAARYPTSGQPAPESLFPTADLDRMVTNFHRTMIAQGKETLSNG